MRIIEIQARGVWFSFSTLPQNINITVFVFVQIEM